MNSYEAKQEARRERLEARAERLSKESAALYQSASTAASAIPFGQPILVGHHSEKRDRNYRAKFCHQFDKAHELSKEAGEAAARADSVGRGGISSDDPDAVVKLREELELLKVRQALMVAANKLIRKKDRAGLIALCTSEKVADALLVPDFAGRLGFPSYELTNNSANIRRIEQRIEHLLKQAKAAEEQPIVERIVGDVRVVENREDNRMQLFFPGKPNVEMRTRLKGRGFRWSPTAGAWQAHLSNASRWAAGWILGEEA